MTPGPDLFVATRSYDLPPKWDGRPVDWSEWRPARELFICPPPPREPCRECKSTAPSLFNVGVVQPLPGETFEVDRVKRTKSGREYVSGKVAKPAWPLVRLHLFRCPDCLHDTVFDTVTDEWWDLDPSDYEPEGSRAP